MAEMHAATLITLAQVVAPAQARVFRCLTRPLIERAVLDWQHVTLDGFTDCTYLQLTLAVWLRLTGGVERKVGQLVQTNPGLADKSASEYSGYSYYTEEKVVVPTQGERSYK